MEITGRVDHDVIVPQGDATLPEGATVRIVYDAQAQLAKGSEQSSPNSPPRIETTPDGLPIVRGGAPGTLHLTNEQIYEILNQEEDENARRSFLGLPDPTNVNSTDRPNVSS